MTRRILVNALVLLVAALLIGCGGNAASPAPTASNTPPAATPPPSTPTPPSNPSPPSTPAPSSSPTCNYSYATFKGSDGNDASFLYSINDNGVMVGTDSKGGFVVQNGQFTYLTFNGAGVTPFGIANNGLIVGTYSTGDTPNATTHGVIYNNGQYTSFDAASNTFPFGINSDGTTVGNAHLIAATYGSNWLRKPDGTFIGLSDGLIPEGLRNPGDINDSGVVVLSAYESAAHANDYATWQNGTFTYHAFPFTAVFGLPNGNDNQGDIVGSQGGNGAPTTGWAILGSTACANLVYPGAMATYAEDINDSRVIVGYYVTSDFKNHAFVATPK